MRNLKNKNWILKLIAGLILVIYIWTTLIPASFSADLRLNATDELGNISIGRCINKGELDFLGLMQTVFMSTGFTEILTEPWNDLFARNQCHSSDLLQLLKQRDQVMKSLRSSLLRCKTENLSRLTRVINELTAEIYYVRHVIGDFASLNLPYDLFSTRMVEDKVYGTEALFTPRDQLYTEMKERFGTMEFINQAGFDFVFSKFENKYSDRKYEYIYCNNPDFQAVINKFIEFVETVGGTGPASKGFAKSMIGKAERIVETATDTSLNGANLGILQVNLNGREPIPELLDLADKLVEESPDFSAPTQESVFKAMVSAETNYDLDTERRMLTSRFESLYKNGSDDATALLVAELQKLHELINNTYLPISTVLQCVDIMNSKQCPGK